MALRASCLRKYLFIALTLYLAFNVADNNDSKRFFCFGNLWRNQSDRADLRENRRVDEKLIILKKNEKTVYGFSDSG